MLKGMCADKESLTFFKVTLIFQLHESIYAFLRDLIEQFSFV